MFAIETARSLTTKAPRHEEENGQIALSFSAGSSRQSPGEKRALVLRAGARRGALNAGQAWVPYDPETLLAVDKTIYKECGISI